jgi:hypothetical protein
MKIKIFLVICTDLAVYVCRAVNVCYMLKNIKNKDLRVEEFF